MSDPDRADRIRACDCPEYRYRVCDVCQCVTGVEPAEPAPSDRPTRLRDLITKYREKSAEFLEDWQDWDSHDGHERCGQGIAYSDVADELEKLFGEAS